MDGSPYRPMIEEITVPKLALQTIEYRSGGMASPVSISMGHEEPVFEFTLGEYTQEILKKWGTCDHKGAKFRVMGSINNDEESCEVQTVEITIHGRIKEIESSAWKGGESQTEKVSCTCGYLKITINGAMLCEIDIVNMIWKNGETDLLADHRAAIGM